MRRLGVERQIAPALFSIAQLQVAARKDLPAAEPYAAEAYEIVVRLGIVDGIAAIGLLYGQLLAARGTRGEATEVLTRSRDAFAEMDQDELAAQVSELITTIEKDTGADP